MTRLHAWRMLMTAVVAAIAGILYQYLLIGAACTITLACSVIGLAATFVCWRHNLTLQLIGIFFYLASACTQLHLLQMQLKLIFLQQQHYVHANVVQVQQADALSPATLTLEINDLGLYPYKITALKVTDQFLLGDTVLLKPARLNFLSQKSSNIWLMREKNLATVIPKKWGLQYSKKRSTWVQKVLRYKDQLQAQLASYLSIDTGKLFTSVFLGKKTMECDDQAKELFCLWGLSHFLARSGLHVAIFVGILWWILSWLPIVSMQMRSAGSLLLLGLYSTLSWPSISFVRACSLYSLALLARILRLRSNGLHLLAIITLSVILHNPFELLCVDFQLSFSLTFALMLGSRLLNFRQG